MVEGFPIYEDINCEYKNNELTKKTTNVDRNIERLTWVSLKLWKIEDPSLWKAESSGVGWILVDVDEHGTSNKREEDESLKRDRRFGRW